MAGSLRAKLVLSSSAILWLALTVALASPAGSTGTLYRYQDEHGVTGYTDSWDRIPEQARSTAQPLDGDTLEPVTPGTTTPPQADRGPSQPTLASSPEPAPPSQPSAWRPWIDRLADLNIPLPSSYETGVGLTALVLIVWGFVMIRMTGNALVKLLVKIGLLLVAGGAAYALYFSGLSERVTAMTGRPAHSTITGKELLGTVEEKAGKVVEQVKQTAADRLKEAAGKAREATVGEVDKTVEQANESTRRLQEQLERIEPPHPPDKP